MEKKEVRSMHIVDCHCHIYPDKIAARAVAGIGAFYDLPMHCAGTFDDALMSYAGTGIDRAIIFSVATSVSQVQPINRFIAECVKNSDGMFIGLGALHPDSPTLKEDIDEIVALGLRGVKLHHDVQRFKMDDFRCLKIYELCEGRLPVLLHTGDKRYDYSNTNRLIPILETYENLTVIGAHFGGWSRWQAAAQELASYPNFYADCCSSLYAMSPKTAWEIVKTYGADRVLFGTDYPMWDPSEELARFNAIPLTEEERQQVLWKNADRLFGLGLA